MEKREILLINRITNFTFQLCRKKTEYLYLLENQWNDILFSLKSYISITDNGFEKEKYIHLIVYLYKLTVYTRDITSGKGERDLTYMMITVWYKIFPLSAIYLLNKIVENPLIGSWKDIPYLCHYLKYRTTILSEEKKEKCIQEIIHLMNGQLYQDQDTITKNQNQIYNQEKSISFVAKWIPREHHKFGWIYELLVQNWKNHSKIRETKKTYRKIIANMNRLLQTTQIKQCERKVEEINYDSISLNTKIQNTIDLSIVNTNPSNARTDAFSSNARTDAFSSNKSKPKNQNHPSIHYDLGELYRNIDVQDHKQIIWRTIRENIQKQNQTKYILPILDIHSNNIDDGIAISIMISEISKLEDRIMIYDQKQPTWISLEKKVSLDPSLGLLLRLEDKKMEIQKYMLQPFMKNPSPNNINTIYRKKNATRAIELIIQSIIETNMQEKIQKELILVIISDFSWNENKNRVSVSDIDDYHYIKNTFDKYNIHIIPRIVFWNISNNIVSKIPCPTNTSNVLFLAGASSINFTHLLSAFSSDNPDENTPFAFFQKMVNQEKYDDFETHIRTSFHL